jgi:hypothetical protein
VKTMTSRSQRIVPMLPQKTMQPKNKEACTAAPLHPPEHRAKSFDPCVYSNEFYAVFVAIVVMADHDSGRHDGGLLGWKICWSGLEVIGNYSEPTRRTLMHRNITTAGGDTSGDVGPAGQTSNQTRCAISSTGSLSQQGDAGLPCQVSTNGVSLVPILELKGDSIEGIHPPWMCISMSQRGSKVYQMLEPLVNSTACRQGGTPPHCWWVGGR